MDNDAVDTMIIATLQQHGTVRMKKFAEKMPGLDRRSLDNALRRLKNNGKIEFGPKGWSLRGQPGIPTPLGAPKPATSTFDYDDEPETRDRVGS